MGEDRNNYLQQRHATTNMAAADGTIGGLTAKVNALNAKPEFQPLPIKNRASGFSSLTGIPTNQPMPPKMSPTVVNRSLFSPDLQAYLNR
jgi:hypothetical protein